MKQPTPTPTWQELHDPDDIERERAIRRDQRRLDFREFEALAKDIQFLLGRLEQPNIDQPTFIDTVERIQRLMRRLLVVAERKAQAA